MNNKHSSCARNRNENGTVNFYARKHAVYASAALHGLARRTRGRRLPLLHRYFFCAGLSALERAAEVS